MNIKPANVLKSYRNQSDEYIMDLYSNIISKDGYTPKMLAIRLLVISNLAILPITVNLPALGVLMFILSLLLVSVGIMVMITYTLNANHLHIASYIENNVVNDVTTDGNLDVGVTGTFHVGKYTFITYYGIGYDFVHYYETERGCNAKESYVTRYQNLICTLLDPSGKYKYKN